MGLVDPFPDLSPGATPTYDEIVQAIRDLHDAQKNITVEDLPIKQLQDRLELGWQPDASLLLGGVIGVVDADMKGFVLGGVHVRWGTATITFTASNISDTPSVAHGLGTTPAAVIVGTTNRFINVDGDSYTDTSFGIAGYHLTLATPTGSAVVNWVAFV